MRKIKKFKIPVYTYDILRKAKKRKIDLFALGLAAQESAREYIASLAAAIEPAVVFDFLDPKDPLAKGPGPLEGGSLTLGALTLGAPFADKLGGIKEPDLLRLAETAALVFGDTGLKVITELISQESGMESFEPGDAAYLFACPQPETEGRPSAANPGTAAAALARLQADKIGVGFENGTLSPKYSLLFALPWLSRKKKKLSAAPGN
ncbi:MAG: hypothetical protein HY796_01375 [Elusimicrobia bacterium]|nr:hypothetical protein [Elusimicrobiota bacterium]